MALNAYGELSSPRNDSYGDLASLGLWTSIAGGLVSAVNNFAEVRSEQYRQESQALSQDLQESLSARNARNAEMDAQAIMESSRREAGRVAQQYGQVKAGVRASTAGRGIQMGVGSAAEVQASIESSKQEDVYAINSNAVRAANAARTQAVNERIAGSMARVSAANMRGTAGSLDPYSAAGTSLLMSASGISQQWLARERYRNRARY